MPVHPNRSPVASGRSGTVVATLNHYEAVHIEALISPIPSECRVSYYNQFIVQFSVYVHDIPFTEINKSTVPGRCGILEVAPWIQEVASTTEMCNVVLCYAWHLVPHTKAGT